MSYLEIRDLNKKYSDTVALRDISFSMKQGETLSIIGSSGSGKTTLLRCLNGLETYDRGETILEGKSLQKGNKGFSERPFGLVFQNFQLFPQYTALENVTLALKLKKTASVKEIEEKGLSLLKKMGLGEPPGLLSLRTLRRSAAACRHRQSYGSRTSGPLLR